MCWCKRRDPDMKTAEEEDEEMMMYEEEEGEC